MLKNVQRYMEEQGMISPGCGIVVGVSGGADSVALLYLLWQLREVYAYSLYVVHINHGIRTEAAEDAAYVEQLCQQWKLPFYLFEEDIKARAAEWNMSEEEAGREYRYRCFLEVAHLTGADRIATAHHMGDQAETVLFHLIRGSGLSGMVGIRSVGEYRDCKLIRPLLDVQKEEIVAYLRQEQISWKEDCTNSQNLYARNRIRNEILPKLCEVNAGAIRHIAEFAHTAAGQQHFMETEIQEYLQQNLVWYEAGEGCEMNRERLAQRENFFVQQVIYEMLVRMAGRKKNLTREHVEAVYRLMQGQSGKRISLPYGLEADVTYERIRIYRRKEAAGAEWQPRKIRLQDCEEQKIDLLNGRTIVIKVINKDEVEADAWKNLQKAASNTKNNYTKLFDCDTIKDTLYVRKSEEQDFFVMDGQGHRKKLSRYFKDCKIPKEERLQSLVVAQEQEVLWLIGRRRCENHRVDGTTKRILIIKCEGEKDGNAD